jgi:hypothetical protein
MTSEKEVREQLVKAFQADLIGPFVPDDHPQGGQEILPLPPSRWYLTGFLAPRASRLPPRTMSPRGDGRKKCKKLYY